MPNLVMEYSLPVENSIDVRQLLKTLHQVALNSGLFDLDSVKSRAVCYQNWLIGKDDTSVDFIHINFDLLSGRTQEQKISLSHQLMQTLKESAGDVHSLTINIRDMDRECFQKVLN